MGGQLFLLDWKTGRRAALLDKPRPVTYCEFAADGRLIFQVASRSDLGEEEGCFSVDSGVYGTWRNGCICLADLSVMSPDAFGRSKTGQPDGAGPGRAKEDSDEMMVTYCFIEEDLVNKQGKTATLFHAGEADQETKWERKLRKIAEEHGKVYETSKTVWGVDFHDHDTICLTKVSLDCTLTYTV